MGLLKVENLFCPPKNIISRYSLQRYTFRGKDPGAFSANNCCGYYVTGIKL